MRKSVVFLFIVFCFASGIFMHGQESFIEHINNHYKENGGDWKALLVEGIPDNAFELLERELEDIIDNRKYRAVNKAFWYFVAHQGKFRADTAYALLDGNKFTPHQRNLKSQFLLASLVEYATHKKTPVVDPPIFKALYRHRAYRQYHEDCQKKLFILGCRIRTILLDQVAMYKREKPETTVPLFGSALFELGGISARQLPDWKGREQVLEGIEEQLRKEMIGYLAHENTSGMIKTESLTDVGTPLLLELVKQLVTAVKNDERNNLTIPAIQRNLDRAVKLWSDKFTFWHPTAESTKYDNDLAYSAEKQLYDILKYLETNGHETIMKKELTAKYITLVSFWGGWDNYGGDKPTHRAKPYWARKPEEFKKKDNNPLITPSLREVVSLKAYRDLFGRFNRQIEGNTIWTNHTKLMEWGNELLELGKDQALPIAYDLMGNPITENNPAAQTPPVLSLTETNTGSLLHPVHRTAIRQVLAGFYNWRGDIAYRNFGPSVNPDGRFTAKEKIRQLQHLGTYDYGNKKNCNYFKEAYNLLVKDVDGDIRGPGLFGRVLDLEKEEILREAELRIAQIKENRDYMAGQLEWPEVYIHEMLDKRIDSSYKHLEDIQKLIQNNHELGQKEIEIEISENNVKSKFQLYKAEVNIRDSFTFGIAAAKERIKGFNFEVEIAKLKKREAEYLEEAAQKGVLIAANKERAEEFKKKQEAHARKLFEAQVGKLRKAIDPLPKRIKQLHMDIKEAEADLASLSHEASSLWNLRHPPKKKSFWDSVKGVVKKIASVVSIYYTGVDLVSIAENAIIAGKAIQNNNWADALSYGFSAVDAVAKGKVTQYLQTNVANLDGWISNTLNNNVGDIISGIAGKVGLDQSQSLSVATALLSKKLSKYGISVLAEKSNLGDIAGELGIDTGEAALQDLSDTMKPQLDLLRDEVKTKILKTASGLGDDLKQSLEEKLSTSQFIDLYVPAAFEEIAKDVAGKNIHFPTREIVTLINTHKDKIIADLAQKHQKDINVVKKALDDIIKKSEAFKEKFPVPLPDKVVTGLQELQKKMQEARAGIGILLGENKDKRNQLVDQLANISDKGSFQAQLGEVKNQLDKGITTANNNMVYSMEKLEELKNQLSNLNYHKEQAEFEEKYREWMYKAAKENSYMRKAMLMAASKAKEAATLLISRKESRVREEKEELKKLETLFQAHVHKTQSALYDFDTSKLELTLKKLQKDNLVALKGYGESHTGIYNNKYWLYHITALQKKLVQVWRLLKLYEPPSIYISFKISYELPTLDVLNSYISGLRQILKNTDRNTRTILSSMCLEEFKDALISLDDESFETVVNIRSLKIIKGAPLIIKGRSEMKMLLESGIRFEIIPKSKEIATVRSFRYVIFDDYTRRRVRLIAVRPEVTSGVGESTEVLFFLYPEGKSNFIKIENTSYNEITLPAPEVYIEDLQKNTDLRSKGIILEKETFSHKGLQTRPFFGTFLLSIDDTNYNKFDLDNAEIRLDFIAVGY